MDRFNYSLTLLANIKLNPDILNTGLINIVILVAFLIYALTEPSQELLEERQKNIEREISDSKSRLKEAERRLKEAQKQYQQAQIAKKEIEKRFLEIRKASLNQSMNLAKKDLETVFIKAIEYYSIKSEEVVEEITSEIKVRVYDELVIMINHYLKSKTHRKKYIDKRLNQLQNQFKKNKKGALQWQ